MKSQVINNSAPVQGLVHAKVQSDRLTIRKVKSIPVRFRDHGYFTQEDLTVQIFEDGIMVHCNHAGHSQKVVEFTVPVWNGDAFEPTGTEKKVVEACDKCPAWSHDGKEWYE